MPSALGDKIRHRRKSLGMTLDDLAAATESSKSYLWDLENKDVARPSAEKLQKIALALKVTPEFLLDEKHVEPTQAVQDQAFFRKYQRLSPETKEKLNRILDVLDEE